MSADGRASSSQAVRVIRHRSRYFCPSRRTKVFLFVLVFCRLHTSVKELILTLSVKSKKYDLLTSLTPTVRGFWGFFPFFAAWVVDILRRRSHACTKNCQLGLRGSTHHVDVASPLLIPTLATRRVSPSNPGRRQNSAVHLSELIVC